MRNVTKPWIEFLPPWRRSGIAAGVLVMICCAGIATAVLVAQVRTNAPPPAGFGQSRQVVDPCAAPAIASVPAGTAFRVCMSHDGINTTDYVLTVDKPNTTADFTATKLVSALVNGAILFDVPAQTTAGAYTVKVCARGGGGTTCSDLVPLTVAPPPLPPAPVKPGIKIIGTATIAGRRMPITIDVERVEGQ